jgi:hypothetical protein
MLIDEGDRWLEDFSNPYMVEIRELLKGGTRSIEELHAKASLACEEVDDPNFPAVYGEIVEKIVFWDETPGGEIQEGFHHKGIVYNHPDNSGPWMVIDGGPNQGVPGNVLWVVAPKASHIFQS